VDAEELQERRRAAENEAGRLKRAVPRITLLNQPVRHHEVDGSLTADSATELGGARRVGVQPNAAATTHVPR
jgi:hypothetical protein